MAAHQEISSTSFLEYAFLRWVLRPAVLPGLYEYVVPQQEVRIGDRWYQVDYEIAGAEKTFVIELDGLAFHGSRRAFSYDRMRQNDLQAADRIVARFSYDSIRSETARCVKQLQALLLMDPLLGRLVDENPEIEEPEMDPDPLHALGPSPIGDTPHMVSSYFDAVRSKFNLKTLRECQTQAFEALSNYYGSGGTKAACVMSVGSGKTALGIAASLAFANRRAMIVTPGNVIRGVFDRAFDHNTPGNVLYGLPGGPLIPGSPPPNVRTLDREEGTIRNI